MQPVQPNNDRQKPEREPLWATYSSYEQVCNENNRSSRRAGILSDDSYTEIMADPSTMTIKLAGKDIPVLVDMQYGAAFGYDPDRSESLAGHSARINVLSVPIGDLGTNMQEEVGDAVAHSGPGMVYFSDNDGRDSEVLYRQLRARNVQFSEKPLLDSRVRGDGQQASLSLYSIDATPNVSIEVGSRKSLRDIQVHFDEAVYPNISDPANATLLRPGDSFDEHELAAIWDLYVDRFQFLGEEHPISMEDSQPDFLSIFTDPDTTVSIKYVDGKPVCFTYFTEDFSGLYWLNVPYLEANYATADPSLIPVFFPGIVASKESKGNNAREVIDLFAQGVASVGAGCRIYFENTNFSEQYVPQMVYRAAIARSEYSLSQPTKLDQTDYRLIEILSHAA